MKTILKLLFVFLISGSSWAQGGINYKAVIKDESNNLVVNQTIDVRLTIELYNVGIYQEEHNTTTDSNGVVILNIGEGSVLSGDYDIVPWNSEAIGLMVEVDKGNGYVDLGSSDFKNVPYAYFSRKANTALTAETAENVSGLEAIDEGNGIGWRLMDRNSAYFGNIGGNSIDFSYAFGASSVYGATGNYSMALGYYTQASGDASFATGSFTLASGHFSAAIGSNTTASGTYSTSIGSDTTASGTYATSIGFGTTAQSYSSTAIGRFNSGSGSATTWNEFDPLFQIGNGTSDSDRNNALTILKNGAMYINSSGSGINISQSGQTGIVIDDPSIHGIVVNDAGAYGGSFKGSLAGVFATSLSEGYPDLYLGGSDAIISTLHSSADMFLKSNDAVVVDLDYDNNEGGNFRIRNGTGTNVFDVNESGTVLVNGSVVHSSDKRLKKDISDLTYGLGEILQLQPKSYNWKDQEKSKKSLGLIAQDVQPIISEIVNTQDDEMKSLGVNYTELIPVLIKAIQEQQVQIDRLKSTIIEQNKKIETISLTVNTQH